METWIPAVAVLLASISGVAITGYVSLRVIREQREADLKLADSRHAAERGLARESRLLETQIDVAAEFLESAYKCYGFLSMETNNDEIDGERLRMGFLGERLQLVLNEEAAAQIDAFAIMYNRVFLSRFTMNEQLEGEDQDLVFADINDIKRMLRAVVRDEQRAVTVHEEATQAVGE